MWNRLAWAAACLLLLAEPAWAQQTPAADAAASAAMERARRQASGPMRVILEASKSKRRVQEPELADTTEAARRGTARTVAEPALIATRSFVPAALAATAPVPAPNGAQGARTVPASAGVGAVAEPGNASAITTEITLTSDNLQRRADNVATPALESAATQAPVVAPLSAATAAMPVLQATKPKLVTMVEPVVTPALLDGVRADAGVMAELTIRADGTVASVSVLPPASRQLVRVVVAALEQWRFEPLPSERVHRVQLVFND